MDNPVKYKKLPADPCLSKEQLFRYIDGKLSSAEMHAVEKHLIECDFCSDALEGLQLVKDRSKAAAVIPVAGEEEEEDRKIIPLFRNRRIIFALAASVVLVLGISVVMRFSMNSDENAKMADANTKADSTSSISVQKPGMAPAQDTLEAYRNVVTGSKQDEPAPKMLAEKQAADLKNAPETPNEGPKAGQGADNRGEVNAQVKEMEKDQVVTAPAQQQADELQKLDMDTQPVQLAQTEKSTKPDSKKNESSKDKAPAAPMAAGGAATPRAESNSHYQTQEDDYKVPATDTATVIFDVPASASDKESESNYNTGLKLLNAGNAAAALPYFESILGNPNDPLFEDAQWQKAEALIKLNRKDEAKTLLNEIVKKNGKYKKQAEDKLKTL